MTNWREWANKLKEKAFEAEAEGRHDLAKPLRELAGKLEEIRETPADKP